MNKLRTAGAAMVVAFLAGCGGGSSDPNISSVPGGVVAAPVAAVDTAAL